MRLGLICSSGGSVFAAGIELLRTCGYSPSAFVVTDRFCGVESECERLNIEWTRIEDSTCQGFSRKAASWLIEGKKTNWICLLFSRLVSSELFDRTLCVNIHPSLLPAFSGFGAVSKARESNARFLGATAHFVDESIDSGFIIGQVIAPLSHKEPLSALERISFAQKLYLFLVLWEMAEHRLLDRISKKNFQKSSLDLPMRCWANPALKDQQLAMSFEMFIKNEGIKWDR